MSQTSPVDLPQGHATTGDADHKALQESDFGQLLFPNIHTGVHGLRPQMLDRAGGAQSPQAEAILPQIAISNDGKNSTMGFVRGATQSFAYALVQSPLEGFSQTIDHTLGKSVHSDLYARTKDLIVSAPKPADFGTAEWHGQSIGGALGIIPWFLATRAALRSSAGLLPATQAVLADAGESAVAARVFSAAGGKMILESGVTAAAYAGAFKPIDPVAGNYWSQKAGIMAGDFETFATLTASSIYIGGRLGAATRPLLESSPGAAQVTKWATSALSGALSGVPAAAVQTGNQYLFSSPEHRPGLTDLAKNAYTFAVVGAALSAGQPLKGPAAAKIKTGESQSATPESGDSKTPSKSDNFGGFLKEIGFNYDKKPSNNGPEAKASVSDIWDNLNESQRQLSRRQLQSLAADYAKLDPIQWRTMTDRETMTQLKVMKDYRLDRALSGLVVERPDLRDWLAKNDPDTVGDTELIVDKWDRIPANLKSLQPRDLFQVAYNFERMEPSDWAKVPPEMAGKVAETMLRLNFYPADSHLLAQSPDFASWFDNTGKYEPGQPETFQQLLRIWGTITPEQKSGQGRHLLAMAKRVEQESTINNVFGKDSKVLPYLASLEGDAEKPLTVVADWLKGLGQAKSPDEKIIVARELVQDLVSKGAPSQEFQAQNLNNQLRMTIYFGEQPALKSKIEEIFTDESKLFSLLSFIGSNPEVNLPLVDLAIEHGFAGRDSDWSGLYAAADLVPRLGLDAGATRQLFTLQSQGLKLSELERYTNENSDAVPEIKSMIENQGGVRELDPRNLADKRFIGELHGFSQIEVARLMELQMQGLSLMRLGNHLKDKPGDIEAFKTLLGSGADLKQLNDYMRLAAVPSAVDLKLVAAVKKGDITTEDVLAKLKSWESGRNFRDLLINHVTQGAKLSGLELNNLQNLARSMSKEHPLTVGRDYFNVPGVSEAATFVNALKGIEEQIPADKPVVLLGRDAWPLLPILRLAGRDVHYFLWSRLQSGDAATKQQWLREIPPNAAVVDTGYTGSIINTIKEIDPGVSGYLMHSNRPKVYPKLLTIAGSESRIDEIENLPKLIYRTSAHTKNGGAVSRMTGNNRDTDASSSWEKSSRWYIERSARELLRATGLPEWDVWRYSQFVGLTPKERLGLDSQQQVEEHYQSVQKAREPAQKEAAAQAATTVDLPLKTKPKKLTADNLNQV